MHTRFLVTFNKEQAQSSQAARHYVINYLDDNGFAHSDTRWGYGLADSYVIGGRWSGELSQHSWAQQLTEKMEAIEEMRDIQVGVMYGDKSRQNKQRKLLKEFQQMWDSAAPNVYVGIPVQRDTYASTGYEDDAMLLTKALYDNLLKDFEGAVESEYHADLDCDEISPDMIGKKWIVVVDYHT